MSSSLVNKSLLRQYGWQMTASVTATLCTLSQATNRNTFSEGEYPLSDFSPFSPIRILRPNPHLEIAFDVRTRNPVYALERIVVLPYKENNSDALATSTGKRPHFFEESSLPVTFRSRLESYHLTGYDRGHLVPAADFAQFNNNNLTQLNDDANINHKGHHQYYRDTFNLCNVSPQVHEMNLRVWSRLEDWVRKIARRFAHDYECFVITGPLWLPTKQTNAKVFEYQYPAIGVPPQVVSVPTHFFKVVVLVNKKQHLHKPMLGFGNSNMNAPTIQYFACFVVPNSSHDDHTRSNNLQDFVVSWTDLETVSGLTFFPTLVNAEWKANANAVTQTLLPAAQNKTKLITSGETSKANYKKSKPYKHLQHLCNNNACDLSKR